MRRSLSLVLILLSIISSVCFAAAPPDSGLAPMLQNVMPAVVNIKAKIKVTDFKTLQELQKRRSGRPGDNNDSSSNIFVSIASGDCRC